MKKILSLTMIVAMLFCFASVAFAAAPSGQIAYYTFDGNDEGLTAVGENFTYADGTVTLGAESYYTSDVNLKGLTEITVAVRAKCTDENCNWAFEITSQEEHGAWLNGGEAESYLGAILGNWGTDTKIERYYQGREDGVTNAVTTLVTGEWYDLVYVFAADGTAKIYVNGELKAECDTSTSEKDYSIANCIGENPTLKIGKACWAGGEYADNTVFDTLAVYNKALSADEVATALVEAEEAGAPQTGVATIALAVVAMLSGAYVVSKKH